LLTIGELEGSEREPGVKGREKGNFSGRQKRGRHGGSCTELLPVERLSRFWSTETKGRIKKDFTDRKGVREEKRGWG